MCNFFKNYDFKNPCHEGGLENRKLLLKFLLTLKAIWVGCAYASLTTVCARAPFFADTVIALISYPCSGYTSFSYLRNGFFA